MSLLIRPYDPARDELARLDIANQAYAEYPDFVPDTLETQREWDKWPSSTGDRRFVAELDRKPVGFGLAFVDPNRAEPLGLCGGPSVLPESRRRGIGTALVRAVLDNLRERGMKRAQAQTRDTPVTRAFLESLGFRLVRTFSNLRRGLSALPALTAGADVVAVEPSEANLAVLVRIENEAFKEHFNYRSLTLAEAKFYHAAIAAEGGVGRLLFARFAGEPVGYLVYGYEPRTFAHLGAKRGTLWDIGVFKPHRGRGLASALMIRAMHDLCRDGLADVELHVDDTNVTGARRLYEKLGFALARRSLTHEQDITVP